MRPQWQRTRSNSSVITNCGHFKNSSPGIKTNLFTKVVQLTFSKILFMRIGNFGALILCLAKNSSAGGSGECNTHGDCSYGQRFWILFQEKNFEKLHFFLWKVWKIVKKRFLHQQKMRLSLRLSQFLPTSVQVRPRNRTINDLYKDSRREWSRSSPSCSFKHLHGSGKKPLFSQENKLSRRRHVRDRKKWRSNALVSNAT